ncbi:MAG TPA: 23S rRNA (uracil(1939)-C(5))-methyltransferase RlmD, partial [Gammaproteobacteria bacterium]|nr:23S rRNA (uracil(1939)-C(5))-methyltransferase RlmD [Gammaproteobacteria bacterium]
KPLSTEDLAKLSAFGQANHIHIYLQPNPPEPINLLWPQNIPHRLSYRLPDFNLEILFHPMDFTQIHVEINRLMVKQAITLLDPQADENILDLFCGVGNFSLPLSRSAKKVTGIEGSEIMVERGYENAAHNAITNIEFYAANLFELPVKADWYNQTYQKILIDPPRTGAREIVEQISRFNAKRIVYVSCNPATLARDANILVETQGYKLQKAGVMNMFPHTSHIEAMAVFEKE